MITSGRGPLVRDGPFPISAVLAWARLGCIPTWAGTSRLVKQRRKVKTDRINGLWKSESHHVPSWVPAFSQKNRWELCPILTHHIFSPNKDLRPVPSRAKYQAMHRTSPESERNQESPFGNSSFPHLSPGPQLHRGIFSTNFYLSRQLSPKKIFVLFENSRPHQCSSSRLYPPGCRVTRSVSKCRVETEGHCAETLGLGWIRNLFYFPVWCFFSADGDSLETPLSLAPRAHSQVVHRWTGQCRRGGWWGNHHRCSASPVSNALLQSGLPCWHGDFDKDPPKTIMVQA